LRLMECSAHAKCNADIENSLLEADYIIISAWDLFTSTISNLIIGGMKDVMLRSSAKIIYVWNTTNKWWETEDFMLIDFVEELEKYLWKRIDYFVVNNKNLLLEDEDLQKFHSDISVKWGDYIFLSPDEVTLLVKNNTHVIAEDLLDRESFYKHHKKRLAKVLKKIITQ
jgi:2-phospho-L-lactate transferase/gluconeogenesis factor (CofD/UPF0052 family)